MGSKKLQNPDYPKPCLLAGKNIICASYRLWEIILDHDFTHFEGQLRWVKPPAWPLSL